MLNICLLGLPQCLILKESTCNTGATGDSRFNPWGRKIPWNRAWQPTQFSWKSRGHEAWWAPVLAIAKIGQLRKAPWPWPARSLLNVEKDESACEITDMLNLI